MQLGHSLGIEWLRTAAIGSDRSRHAPQAPTVGFPPGSATTSCALALFPVTAPHLAPRPESIPATIDSAATMRREIKRTSPIGRTPPRGRGGTVQACLRGIDAASPAARLLHTSSEGKQGPPTHAGASPQVARGS